MSSRYRVEYQLKSHRKDAFIEWIKGLLAVPFVLHSFSGRNENVKNQYKDIFGEIERLIDEKRNLDLGDEDSIIPRTARLDKLVPTIGRFFTPLPLAEAFLIQDAKRGISSRMLVSPSFNDIRHILNTAQVLQLAKSKQLRMLTFDGDVTLYEDGGSLTSEDKIVSRLLILLRNGYYVGIVTAAGYDEAENYERRLFGLVRRLEACSEIPIEFKKRLCIMGGESNFLFRYRERSIQDGNAIKGEFEKIPDHEWMFEELKEWGTDDIKATLDRAEAMFCEYKTALNLPKETMIIRKDRAVGIVPGTRWDTELKKNVRAPLLRESLEELVLSVQHALETYPPAANIKFSCFDGGSDVWCDIGGKDLGVKLLQSYNSPTEPIKPHETLHIGDQFKPMGSANDLKARLAGCTVWISSPQETLEVLDELISNSDLQDVQ